VSVVAQAAVYGSNTATWAPGTLTLTDTVTSGGQFIASYGGQVFAGLNTPLPGWPSGQPV
jgi:hypothetical protein